MFDWMDWGKNMGYTTNELAGVNPFMGYAGGIFFIIAAVLGIYMFTRVLQKKENDMFVTLLHFVAGATVFMMMVMQLIAGSASGDPMHPEEAGLLLEALLLSGIMLSLGGFIWRDRLNKKRTSMLIYAHVVGGLITGAVLTFALIELSEH
jgi:predicted membrane channel-forming protein YqfA (hemolysin III family)